MYKKTIATNLLLTAMVASNTTEIFLEFLKSFSNPFRHIYFDGNQPKLDRINGRYQKETRINKNQSKTYWQQKIRRHG